MMKDFLTLINKLERGLKQPLPGRKGQIIMAPQPVEEERFAPDPGNDTRKGAVMILIYPDRALSKVPFIKRAVYPGAHSGQVSFPGGKWEQTDLDLEATAIRETEEELGVEGSRISVIGELTPLYIPPSNFTVQPFVGFTENEPVFNPDPREVARVISCDFYTLLDYKIRKEKLLDLKGGAKINAPYFAIANEMVWGATAMILSELLSILESIGE
ncbi:NUDIX hydrolase [Negadavirga shengliensis]|uniref:NUDIX hydrolase n=1 Tax=Negadavirga shengliensis TaxID=1389218 RepID=A0ABV9T1H9_9BACT